MASIRTITVAALAVTLLAGGMAPAKADNELKGGILGGAAGAGIGGALGGGTGAAIGGVLGLGLGALGANQLSKPKAEEPAAAQPGQRDLTFAVQNELVGLGYDPGPVDGVNGQRTQEAIRAYQYRFGLPIDGIASRPLLDHMRYTRAQAARAQQPPATYQAPPPPTAAQQPPAAYQAPPPPTAAQQPPPYGSQPPPPGYGAPQPAAATAPASQPLPLAAIDQSHCRPYTQTIEIDGQQQMVTSGRACLQPDGNWRIVE